MESKAKFLAHPIHQMLVVFPLGLLGTATVFDAVANATGDRRWSEASYLMIKAGVLAGLTAAIPGLIDFLAIPRRTRARRIGLLHGLGNAAVTGMFAASWLSRRRRPRKPSGRALAVSTAATLLAMVTEWLGGELVDRLAVGVSDTANLDAPSSFEELTTEQERLSA